MYSIEWIVWAVRVLAEETVRAENEGADYLSVPCPACGRMRLQTRGDVDAAEGAPPRCEKCRWKASYAPGWDLAIEAARASS